ncbi:phosphoribosylaminoimidazolesuccinocarboxamide synthase [Agilicoccus flavus]|uniref:phosphoribosylaminoimidazolesuccinocarboxamide synthase n=1 Tax=Agilicoccus flavus TaxID=2775968 RepID=UPI001CF641A5|nr:phosphoribosylaminoimidazolesuccinocarboxamide synthase [Agilicoccus flavus]
MSTHDTTAPQLPGYAHVYSGKVRDLYAPLGPDGEPSSDELLLVASDRISAYDHVLSSVIPDKGVLLTQMSLWWFDRFADLLPHHVVSTDVPEAVAGRAVLVRRLRMVPVECIGRAYLTGSGLAEYRESGSVCGVPLPAGLGEASRLPEAIFTPTTKAPLGEHDQPMTFAQVEAEVGESLAARLRALTTAVLARGNEIAADRGILIADTKVEFGIEDAPAGEEPRLVLADEVLTPDSSRFWRADDYEPGRPQTSYDKQYVRDWLTSPESGWDRNSGAAPPPLPQEVIAATRATYVAAYEALTGRTF